MFVCLFVSWYVGVGVYEYKCVHLCQDMCAYEFMLVCVSTSRYVFMSVLCVSLCQGVCA